MSTLTLKTKLVPLFQAALLYFQKNLNQLLSFKFPSGIFGNDLKERSFKPQWYWKYSWLHYDVTLDKAFCHTCTKAMKLGKISAVKS